MIGKSNTTTITTPQQLARTLAPWLFRTRETYSALPENFEALDNSAKIKTLKLAVEERDVGTIAAFLDLTAETKVSNPGMTQTTTTHTSQSISHSGVEVIPPEEQRLP